MSSWQMFVFGGGKCPNLGVVNVQILGVINVLTIKKEYKSVNDLALKSKNDMECFYKKK